MGRSQGYVAKGVIPCVLMLGQLVLATDARHILPARWVGLLSPEQYQRLVSLVEADLRARKLTPLITPDGTVQIKEPPFDQGMFALDNLVQKCRLADQDKWAALVHEHFDNLVQDAREDQRLREKLKSIDNVLPLLAVRLYAREALPRDASDEIVCRCDLEGTLSVLVLNLPSSLKGVTRAQVKAWGAKEPELFARALRNVKETVAVTEDVRTLPGGAKLVAILGDDLLASTHVLLLKDHPAAIGKAGALVAVPTRHIVLCHPINDRSALSAGELMVPMIRNLFLEGPGSTSQELYWYHEGRFTPIPTEVNARGVTLRPPEELRQALARLEPQ